MRSSLAPRGKWKKRRRKTTRPVDRGSGKCKGYTDYLTLQYSTLRIDLVEQGFLCEAVVLSRVAPNGHVLRSTDNGVPYSKA